MTDRSDLDDTTLLLNAYVDGELDAASTLAFDRRLKAEPDLAAAHARLLALRQDLHRGFAHERAPAALRARLEAMAVHDTRPSPAWRKPHVITLAPRWLSRLGRPEWRPAIAAGLAGLLVGNLGTSALLSPPPPSSAVSEIVSDHLRAVMAPEPFDVASTDKHTVKPWFTGRLPFAPRVFDLAPQGFALIGGRVDVVGGEPAAALVFRHGKHLASLISQPLGPHGQTESASLRGFEVRDWTVGGMRYWAVSDMASAELDTFEAEVKAELARND